MYLVKKYIKKNGKLDFGYKFTYENFRSYLDSCIKKMAQRLNIKSKMSYYSARKTFSQFAFDLGVRIEIIEYCIGQSMKENRPIYSYVHTNQKQADMAIRKVIDYTNDPAKFNMDVIVA
ncbi:hypothetical protein EZS27_014779 [termite gut metagenome]|uniref:Phage integrase SAM-like domain-containing protein n=1 Tax=termite gut metagenome TaxID=433724 RepID=A0A5J4RSW4_9ZZZZ